MVNRPVRRNGFYSIKNMRFPNLFGSRKMVYTFKTAYKTTGGLTRNDLIQNKHGEIVSKKKHFTAKKEKRLIKHGYGTKKGKFGYVKIGHGRRGTRKHQRGGQLVDDKALFQSQPAAYSGAVASVAPASATVA
jgi:hypothetical protein